VKVSHTTRQAIIDTLKVTQHATVNELAEAVGVKPVTVRHHLNVLQAEGLAAARERRQPVGRPIHVFFLTEKADGMFSQKYRVLVERLLDQLKDRLPEAAFEALIADLAGAIADEFRSELASLPQKARMNRLVEILEGEGFIAEWGITEDGIELVEHHCPYYHIGQRHPELCQIDHALIHVAMGGRVEKASCMLEGDRACTFLLPSIQSAVS
jgi:DeoR family suf operon transcriptional repressor